MAFQVPDASVVSPGCKKRPAIQEKAKVSQRIEATPAPLHRRASDLSVDRFGSAWLFAQTLSQPSDALRTTVG